MVSSRSVLLLGVLLALAARAGAAPRPALPAPAELLYIDGPHDMFLPAAWAPPVHWAKRNIAIGRGDGFRPGK